MSIISKPILKEKHWNVDLEKKIYSLWKERKVYNFNKDLDKPVFSIDTPPPYVNTPIHIGQATTYVLMDMFARYKRMKGYNVLFPLGLDKNGLPIEMAVEKRFNIKLTDVPRNNFIEKCNIVLEESSLASTESFLRLGISFNSWNLGNKLGDIYQTDSPDYRALTQRTFIELWEKNLIYEAERINNYCPGCRTTIADAEIEYVELPTAFNRIIFKVKGSGEKLIVGTTRPELLCTCGMVIFNPKDGRYKHLVGSKVISPIYGKEIPIISHPMAEMEKGTGLVMMCSAGDTSDIRFFREMDLNPIIAIDEDGKMNSNSGFLKGLSVINARKKIIEKLEKNGLLESQTKIMHRTPICDRSKDPIEFISMPEYYVKQVKFKREMLKIAEKINFFDPSSKQILLNWINSVSIDWPISRRRYYATEIPLWYCNKCDEKFVPEKGGYYIPWKETPPLKKCPKCNGTKFRGEERVFDTWFDSSNSPLYNLKYSDNTEFFKNNQPCNLRPQGKEIIRTWLYYTLLKGFLLTGKGIFNDVWINYHIVDNNGKKMSKSKGNIISPTDILDKFGAESFRLWTAIEGNLDKTDMRCSPNRIDGAGKTITKIWNISRFVSMFPYAEGEYTLTPLDQWILYEVNELVKYSEKKYENYNFHDPSIRLKNFIWETFASSYIELVKNRLYNSNNSFNLKKHMGAVFTINYCLDIILKLISPILPMLSYKIYSDLRNADINFVEFPKVDEFESEFSIRDIQDLNTHIWKAKKERQLSLKDEIKSATLPKKFKIIAEDIVGTHKIRNLYFGEEIILEF